MIEIQATITGGAIGVEKLAGWIRSEEDLRGTVQVLPGVPRQGKLGDDTIRLLLEGGLVSGLTTAIIAWLRTRRSSVVVRLNTKDKQLYIAADNVRDISPDDVEQLALKLAAELVEADH